MVAVITKRNHKRKKKLNPTKIRDIIYTAVKKADI